MDEKPAKSAPPPSPEPRSPHYWESLVERQIREAMQSGAFEDLPFRGERLPNDRDEAAGEWAMAHRVLRNAGMAPPWIESDKEARRLLAEIEGVIQRAPRTPVLSRGRLRQRLAELVGEANGAIARVNAEAPTARQHRRPVDPALTRQRLDAAFEAGE